MAYNASGRSNTPHCLQPDTTENRSKSFFNSFQFVGYQYERTVTCLILSNIFGKYVLEMYRFKILFKRSSV